MCGPLKVFGAVQATEIPGGRWLWLGFWVFFLLIFKILPLSLSVCVYVGLCA